MVCLYIQIFSKQGNYRTKAGLGFGHYLCPIATCVDLSRSCSGSAQHKVHQMGFKQEPKKSDLAINAIAKALVSITTGSFGDLIHHSAQGVQYASWDYVDYLKAHRIQMRISRKRNPYDNAFAEGFMKNLMIKEIYINRY